jgi:hypothetical protein
VAIRLLRFQVSWQVGAGWATMAVRYWKYGEKFISGMVTDAASDRIEGDIISGIGETP